jgi:excisionase family DNA binding protein
MKAEEPSEDLEAVVLSIRAELRQLRSELLSRPPAPCEPRKSYSVEEVAELLRKAPFTVREWARNGRIRATKRAEKRGSAELWSISADEVDRVQNEGLLPRRPLQHAS